MFGWSDAGAGVGMLRGVGDSTTLEISISCFLMDVKFTSKISEHLFNYFVLFPVSIFAKLDETRGTQTFKVFKVQDY